MKYLIVFAVCCIVIPIYGQPASQNPDRHSQKAEKTQRPTPASSSSTIPNVAPQQPVPGGKADKDSNESPSYFRRLTTPETLPNTLLCIVGIAGIIAAYFTLREMKATTEIGNKTLVLTQRPQLKVKAFYFREIKGVGGIYRDYCGIQAGSQGSGQFYIQNCGGTDARIREIWQDVYIAEKLPMQRPYEGKDGSKEEKTLGPGDSATYLFGLFEPLDGKTYADVMEFKTKRFYVLGWIGYTDNLGIYRRTAFCRVYEPAIDRFVPVDDPDYEYAD